MKGAELNLYQDVALCKICDRRLPVSHFAFAPKWGVKSKCFVGVCKECYQSVKAGGFLRSGV